MDLIRNNLREGWAADSARAAEMGDDELTWPEFANDEDTSLQTDIYCKFIANLLAKSAPSRRIYCLSSY